MARAMADGDTHMEDQGLGMEEPGHSPTIVTYHSDTLLAPNADFMADDRSSAASGMDVVDRLTYLEQRMQMQEDEIQLLKMALADVLKRLNISEEQQAAGRRPSTGLKAARPVSLTLPSKPATAGPSAAPPKKNATLPSASRTQNYTAAPTTSKSAVKSPTDSLKDSSKPKPAAAPTCKKPHDSSKAAKEPGVIVGSRRVTHCKDLSEPPHKKDWVF